MRKEYLLWKRAILPVLLILLLSAVGMTNALAQTFTQGNLNYSINNDGSSVTVTGHVDGTAAIGELLIPESVELYGTTYLVTGIGDYAFESCSGLTGSLVIPNSVITIGSSAFQSCTGFTGSLTIGDAVQSIDQEAFFYCSGFTGSLTIPENVQNIGKRAFSQCEGFTALYYNAINCYIEVEEHEEWNGEEWYFWYDETSVWLFGCSSMTTVVIGENVQTIPGFFGYYSSFAGELVIPESVTSIESYAFDECNFTGSLIIGNSVTSIGEYAFNNAGFTDSLTIGNSMEYIGNYAFSYCGFTGSLTMGNSVTSIGEYAFKNAGFTGSLYIGNSVASIGDYAFNGCNFTGSLYIGNSVTYIGEYAFSFSDSIGGFTELVYNATNAGISSSWLEGVTSLTALSIGESVQRIPEGFVSGINSITGSLTIPNSVTYIGANAFSSCSGFSGTLTIGSSVTQIGNSAFFGACQGFTSFVILPETPPSLGNNVFVSADYGLPVSVPCGSLEAYQGAEGWNVFTNIQETNPCLWMISAEVAPASCGTVSGTGVYAQGQTCTLVAIPNEDFSFVNWTEDGVEVSTDAEYDFTVAENRHLVANFIIDNLIGEGTETSEYLPSYCGDRYSLTQQIYTADEIGQMGVIEKLSFFNGGYAMSRNYDIYLVHTEKTNFSSSTDWVAVSDEDKVFSGNVTMVSNDWTTITFATPFAYNGTSNLVLVVDNNTGSLYYPSFMACRVFGTDEYQSICGYSNTNYDPINPSQYSGSRLTVKNQIALGFSSLSVAVFATVSPEEAGSVSGEGAYQLGETCTLMATPSSSDYVFLNWTENGEVVTTDAQYSFTVTDNRNLVANFIQVRFEITVMVNPLEGGTVNGAGNYEQGQTCTLTATPNEGYVFVNWTENGQEVSVDTAYSFTVTDDRTIMAHFVNPVGTVQALYYPDNTNIESLYVMVDWGTNPFENQIGDGTGTTGYFPFYTLYNYSISESLFLSTELEAAGVTTSPLISLSWYATNAPGYAQQGITIWMANVTDETLTTTSHVVTDMTKVYTGAITPTIGWNEFVFNEDNFAWDGHSNILIYCQRNNGVWNSTVNWQATTNLPFNAMAYKYQDSAPYDPTIANPMITSSTRPNTRFKSLDNETSYYYNVYRTDCDSSNYSLIADNVSETMYVDSLWLQLPIGSYQYGISFIKDDGSESGIVASNCIERILYTYQITAIPNLEGRGTVSGAGEYALGATCTLTATPIGNNTFTCWKEDGTIVSTEANYSFTVTRSRNLVAVFSVSPDDIIVFADNNVKALCVNSWDIDGDDELTYDEASAVTDIGNVFSYHQNITSFDELQYFTGLSSIGYDAFAGCTSLTSIALPEGITAIGSYAFYECNSLTSLVIPVGVSIIGEYAFYDCYNLLSVNIPEGLVSIGENAFYVCGLTGELTLPESLEWVGGYAFFGCDGISKVNYNAINCQTMGSAANPVFYDCAFTHLNIGANVQSIPNFAFKRCFMITDMTVAAVIPPTIYPGTFGMVSRSIPVSVPHGSGDAYSSDQYWEEFFNINEVYFNEVQTVPLAEGWNWFSSNLDITLDDLKTALVEALPGTAITVKSRTQNTAYNPNTHRWMGTLNTLDVTQMYMIYVSSGCEITLEGTPINPTEHPVTINNGSNWIAFPLGESMTVSDAFAGFAVNGDKVKSRNNNTQYIGGSWRGLLTTLVSGQGYMYISNSQETRTFTFPANAK